MARKPTIPKIPATHTDCPTCGGPLRVGATRQQGTIHVTYRTCATNPAHRFRSDTPQHPDQAHCPKCQRPCLPTTTDDYAKRYRCHSCGRLFNLPLQAPASVRG